MNYSIEKVIQLADRANSLPNGIGNSRLAQNSESWAGYLKFLYLLVNEFRPKVCLELGVYMGTATVHMALGNFETQVVGVDREYHHAIKKNTEGYFNIELLTGDTTSEEIVKEIGRRWGGKIGLLFIDSTHDGETPKREFEAYSPLFDDVCIVACDDLLGPEHLKVKMQKFWRDLPGEKVELHHLHPRLNTSYDEPGFGVSIVRK